MTNGKAIWEAGPMGSLLGFDTGEGVVLRLDKMADALIDVAAAFGPRITYCPHTQLTTVHDPLANVRAGKASRKDELFMKAAFALGVLG